MNDCEQKLELMAECIDQLCKLVKNMEVLMREIIRERDELQDFKDAMQAGKGE